MPLSPQQRRAVAFEQGIYHAIKDAGFLAHHSWDSRKSSGPGFPDIVMVHPVAGVIFLELKSGTTSKLDKNQRQWRDELRNAGARHWTIREVDVDALYAFLYGHTDADTFEVGREES